MNETSSAAERRFAFGSNWQSFLGTVGESSLAEAQRGLSRFLGPEGLRGKTFLDIGCGSGLHSLAAVRMGATVTAFDCDPESVACAEELRARYGVEEARWRVQRGDILDREFAEGLGSFDMVYAWGVLHHTGNLWRALDHAAALVSPGGRLFVAVYRDQGWISRAWRAVKRAYCAGPVRRGLMTSIFFPLFFTAGLAEDLGRLRDPRQRYREHIKYRGMSLVHDWRDWLGGYPYEVADAGELVSFFEERGFRLLELEAPDYGFGNNQFVFEAPAEG